MAKSKSTDLTTFMKTASLPELTDADMASAIAEAISDNTGGAGGATFLSFSGKTGVYALGRARADMDPEDVYLLEPQSIVTGWTCWKSNKVADRCEWSIYQAATKAVPENELADHGPYRTTHGEGWARMLGFGVLATDTARTPIQFSTTSVSGRNAVGDLLEEIKKRAVDGDPSIPAIHFERESFVAQEQTNFKPKFAVESWLTRAGVAGYVEGTTDLDDLLAGKEPRKTKSRKKAA